MKQGIWKHKKWFGYSLYGILLTMALLYYRFPSDALRDYLETALVRINPRMVLSLGKVSPSFPLGIKLVGTRLTLKEETETLLFRADSAFVSPHLWSFLKGESDYRFKCQAYGGTLKGRIHFLKSSLEAPFNTSMTLKNIHVDKDTFLPNIIDGHLEGVLEGTIRYGAQNNLLEEGVGEANLKLSDGRTDLLQSILSVESVDFKDLFIKVALKKKIMDLSNTELRGLSMHGMVSGFISLKEEFLKSSLDLRVTIEPFADLVRSLEKEGDSLQEFKQNLKRGKLSFIIRGTMGDPSIQLI